MLALSVAIAAALASIRDARADDPLDDIDGTEGWSDIDTSSVDEAEAWRRWRADLRRWEAGRVRLEAERARMLELRRRSGDTPDEADVTLPPPEQDLQTRIDAARRLEGTGDHQRRDEDGQALDDERPWRNR